MTKQKLTELANEIKKQQKEAKLFQEVCSHEHTRYWIGVYEQASKTLELIEMAQQIKKWS